MSIKKIVSLGLALAMALAATPALAAGQVVMDEWDQPVNTSDAKGGAFSGQAELAGMQGPGGGNYDGNFDNTKGWTNKNAQGPGGGSADANFDKDSDWK
jgi:hypothetical protein